jgi:hypoxanthine phosphoribosyltransferase
MKKRSQPVSKKRRSATRGAASHACLKVAISEKEIRRRVRELAKQIDHDYQGKTLLVVGVLENCLMFVADLVRDLTIPVAYSFIGSHTRDSDSGRVAMREITYIPPVNVGGKHVLLVAGVLQSGVTLDYLCRTLLAQRPTSLRTAALLDKNEERKVDVPVDYAGFKVSDKFLVGYGLGYQDQYRGLPYLAHMTARKTATRRAARRI